MRGPYTLPLIGSAFNILNPKDILPFLKKLKDDYGSLVHSFFGIYSGVVTTDPEIIEKIFTSEIFLNKALVYDPVGMAAGDGLFTSKANRWYKNRKLLNPAFTHKSLLNFFPVFNNTTKILNKKLENMINNNKNIDIDISTHLQLCTLEITFETILGKKVDFQISNERKFLPKLLLDLIGLIMKQIIKYWIPASLYKIIPMSRVFENNIKIVDDIVHDFNTEKLKEYHDSKQLKILDENENEKENITKNQTNFIELAMKLLDSKQFDSEDLQSESKTMILAAFETTANTIYMVLMCLAMHPEIQDRLYEEILALYPDKDLNVNYDDLKHLTYMDMVINETLRLFATVPLVGRQGTKDFHIGNGITIPKGTQILIDIFHMHRDEKIWGPNAVKFIPDEHFSKENFEKIHPYAFIPFTKGLRNCIGWRYALMSLKVMLTQILRSYEFSTTSKMEELKLYENITLKIENLPTFKIKFRSK